MTTLHHAGMTVSEMDRSLGFWRDALGMEVVVDQHPRRGYFEAIIGEHDVDVHCVHLAFPAGGARVELFEFRSPRGGGRHVTRPADVGFAHVCVAVDQGALDDLLARLLAAGGTLVSDGPVPIDAGANKGGRALYLRDPDGHVVELFEPPVR